MSNHQGLAGSSSLNDSATTALYHPRFAGQCALVTGASSGIGRAVALLLASEGATLILTGRKREALDATLDAVRAAREARGLTPMSDLCICADLAIASDRARLVEEALRHLAQRESGGESAGLDALINSAGVIGSGSVEDLSLSALREMFEVNVFAVFEITQGLIPALKVARGSIVNVSSISGLKSFPSLVAYCSSKGALNQITQCAALDLAPSGVRVNAVCPGVVVTELHKRGGMDDEAYERFLRHCEMTHPLQRVGEAGEIADLISFLASKQAGWITGVTMPIDGGRHLTCAR